MAAHRVTVNADLGESVGLHAFGHDTALLAVVDVANVACGFHAGDPTAMARTVRACAQAGVDVGAHPGLPDVVGFGRREMALTAEEVRDLVRYQVGALRAFTDEADVPLVHVKPHGALYGMTARDDDLARAVCDVARAAGLTLYGLPGSAHERAAAERGVPFVGELYVDLDYRDDGSLVVARRPVPPPLDAVVARVRDGVGRGVLRAGGTELPVAVGSVCVHSDHEGAVGVAWAVSGELARLRGAGRPEPGAPGSS